MTRRLSDCLIPPDASIREACVVIARAAIKIALVVDEDRLLGTVTNGDIRRALLAGRTLDDPVAPVVTYDPKVVSERAARAEVLNLMQAQVLGHIPVVDDSGRLIGLHLLQELLRHTVRPNWAVIMAGGLGTRLGEITKTIPKPMLRIAGRPILERLVLHLTGSGIRRIFISVNHLGHMIEEHFGDGSGFGCEIEYLRESPTRQLGTAGSMRLLLEGGYHPTHPLVVMNGDLVTDFSIASMLAAHAATDAVATMAVRDYAYTVPFHVAETSGARLRDIAERPTQRCLINAGIYVLEPALLEHVPPDRMFHVPELLVGCLQRGELVQTWETADEWQDIGRPEDFRRATGR